MTTVYETLDEVRAAVGQHLGTSDWITLTPDRLDQYGQATGEVRRAGAAPPLLVLALTNRFLPQIVEVRGASAGVNYGTGEIRFPALAPVGSRIRGRADLVACEDLAHGIQTTMRITVEIEDHAEPACVLDALSRWFP